LVDYLLFLAGVLLAATVGAALEYYRHLRRAQKEYEKARGAMDDVILSFNRQLKREAERVELVAYAVESDSSKVDNATAKIGEVEKQLQALEPKIAATLGDRERLLARIDEVDKKVQEAVASQSALSARVSGVEKQVQQFPASPELNIEAVIPIRRERALAQLTETELSALGLLAQEGPKTAPEIKEKIKLSREHTARLMKKLYEEGYLERDTGKIPFKYSVKKEMEKLLKRTEGEVT
jgi:predicted transcriptional regulator